MTTKEKIMCAVDQMSDRQQALLLNLVELQNSGVDVFMMHKGRPVIAESQLSKLDMTQYFADDFAENER